MAKLKSRIEDYNAAAIHIGCISRFGEKAITERLFAIYLQVKSNPSGDKVRLHGN